MSYNTHRSAPTYCTDFGSSIRIFGSRYEMMMLFSTLRSRAWAAKARQPIPKKIEIVIRLSTESNDLLELSFDASRRQLKFAMARALSPACGGKKGSSRVALN